MGKFRQIFTELSAGDTPIFSFLDDNLSKQQGTFIKLAYCIDIKEIWFGIANGLLTKLAICINIIKIWFRIVICPLILSRSGLGLLSVPPSFSFQTFSQR